MYTCIELTEGLPFQHLSTRDGATPLPSYVYSVTRMLDSSRTFFLAYASATTADCMGHEGQFRFDELLPREYC